MKFKEPTAKEKKNTEQIELGEYKGIYYNDETTKYTDPKTGAHFDFKDMCQRILKIKKQRETTPVTTITITKESRNAASKMSMSTACRPSNTKQSIKTLEENLRVLCGNKMQSRQSTYVTQKKSQNNAKCNSTQYWAKGEKPKDNHNKENTTTFDKKIQEQMYTSNQCYTAMQNTPPKQE